MVIYYEDGDVAVVDGYKFRRDKNTGYFLSSSKIDGKRKRLHVYVAEKEFGTIPKGFDVHHIDGDKNNNEPENLEILKSSKHKYEHARRLTTEERDRRAKNLVENVSKYAKEWHASEEGREWHRKHAINAMKNRKKRKYSCSFCGASFETINIYADNENHFCSNKCKSAYRRKSGVDDVEQICESCGKTYMANKYIKRKYCSVCWNKEHRVYRKRKCIQHGSTENS